MTTQTRITTILGLVLGLTSATLVGCDGEDHDDLYAPDWEEEDELLVPVPQRGSIAAPETAPVATATASYSGITCSSAYQPGWCEHLLDKQHGTCNVGEWAIGDQSDVEHWAEITWDAPGVSLAGVKLYDRACPEQILGGTVYVTTIIAGWYYVWDFPFGPLEDSGNEPTYIDFGFLQLDGVRSLRVEFDDDQHQGGPYPGLGEIVPLHPEGSC